MQNDALLKVICRMTQFLHKKNLFDEFKQQYGQELPTFFKPFEQPKKKKKKRKRQEEPQVEQQEPQEPQEPEPQPDPNAKWLEEVGDFQELMEGQYYLFEDCYYKMKSAKATRFRGSFRIDAINTKTSKREEIFVSGNKVIYWASVRKLPVEKEENNYFLQISPTVRLPITNQVHLQRIDKYWTKVDFFGVILTNRKKQPMPQLIFIEFDY